jgi:hypothetical protein
MKKPKILAFGHKSRTGKDTATRLLIDFINKTCPAVSVERRAFADKVKEISYQLYRYAGMKPAAHYDLHAEDRAVILPLLGMDPVEVWVGVGNKIRDIYQDTWIDIALLDCDAELIIVSDLRYPNEADRIRRLGGFCVKIERDDAAIRDTVADNALNDYQDWDLVLENNSTQEALQEQLISLIEKLGWLSEVRDDAIAPM